MRSAIPAQERPARNAPICGIQLCEDHVETRSGCHAIFCPCFFFRSAQHYKAASADHGQVRERKTADPPSRVSNSKSENALSHRRAIYETDSSHYCYPPLLELPGRGRSEL